MDGKNYQIVHIFCSFVCYRHLLIFLTPGGFDFLYIAMPNCNLSSQFQLTASINILLLLRPLHLVLVAFVVGVDDI